MINLVSLISACSNKQRYLVLVCLVAGLAIYFYGSISYREALYTYWDLHDYRAMAQASPGLTENVSKPFVYRIGGPYLVGLLPFSIDENFRITSICLGMVLSCLFYLYLCSREISPSIAALSTTLFILNKYLFGFPVWNYFQVDDILSLIEVLLLAWAMTRRRWASFGMVLVFGSLTKEPTLIMIPTGLIYLVESKSFQKEWKKAFAAIVPACLIAIALRVLLHSSTGYSLLEAFIDYSDKVFKPQTWYRLLVNAFTPCSLVPFIFFESTRTYFKERKYELVYLVIVIVSTFSAYNNERLMGPAFIVFYTLLASILQDNVARSRPIVLTILISSILSSLHHTYAKFPLPRDLTVALSLLSLAVVTGAMIYYRMNAARKGEQSA